MSFARPTFRSRTQPVDSEATPNVLVSGKFYTCRSVCGRLVRERVARNGSRCNQRSCAPHNTAVIGTSLSLSGRFVRLSHNFTAFSSALLTVRASPLGTNESHTCYRTVDVPGPLKCVNSHPTMEGHLHGDVKGGVILTPNEQSFRAQCVCVFICHGRNLQLARM